MQPMAACTLGLSSDVQSDIEWFGLDPHTLMTGANMSRGPGQNTRAQSDSDCFVLDPCT